MDSKSSFLLCNCTVCEKNFCEIENGGCLKSVTKTKHKIEVNYKCVEWVPKDRPLLCYINDKSMSKVHAVKCCRNRDYCAQDLDVRLDSDIDNEPKPGSDIVVNGWKIGLILCLIISLLLFLFFLYICYKYRTKRRLMNNLQRSFRYASSERLTENRNYDMNHIHIAKEIQKDALIGRGKFGSVFRCIWKSQFVSVKVFNSYHRDAWSREEEIYMTPLFRHKNILHFIASDSTVTGLGLELWLITRYYECGSLYDYLNATPITLPQLSSLAKSIAVGLEFIHNEVCGITSSKPGIAHRDLKSSNIMVENDGYTCCIGDFGTAARFYSSTGQLDVPSGQAFGTKRYLAPEFLNGSINVNNFDSLRQADIYAMALIFWELCWRTTYFDCTNTYELPYFESLPSNPTLEDMYTCICRNKIRPRLIESWVECEVNTILSNLREIMKECWAENPTARLPALRVVKKIGDVYLDKFL